MVMTFLTLGETDGCKILALVSNLLTEFECHIKNTKSQLVASNYHDYCEEIKGNHKRFYNEKDSVKVP